MPNTALAPLILIDAYKAKAQESGKPCSDFKTEVFFATSNKDKSSTKCSSSYIASGVPSRMVSDQMINIFFQEWAPLFPVLHRPTILKVYADYVTEPEGIKDSHSLANLNLIFGIAALSAEVRIRQGLKVYLLDADNLYSGINRMLKVLNCSGSRHWILCW